MLQYPPRDPRTIKARFPVWLVAEMMYNNRRPDGKAGQHIKSYKKHTKAEKVPYTKEILLLLDETERTFGNDPNDRAVAVMLDGTVRYMWRSDVLTRAEYDEFQKKQRTGLGNLRAKRKRDVGKGDPE